MFAKKHSKSRYSIAVAMETKQYKGILSVIMCLTLPKCEFDNHEKISFLFFIKSSEPPNLGQCHVIYFENRTSYKIVFYH